VRVLRKKGVPGDTHEKVSKAKDESRRDGQTQRLIEQKRHEVVRLQVLPFPVEDFGEERGHGSLVESMDLDGRRRARETMLRRRRELVHAVNRDDEDVPEPSGSSTIEERLPAGGSKMRERSARLYKAMKRRGDAKERNVQLSFLILDPLHVVQD
jgi:hypothetical protein